MIAHLNLSREEIAEKYWRRNGNTIQMKIVDGHCVFYNNGCTIHPGKPWRCTQWPLHPSILDSEENFEIIKESCPGISRKLSYGEFCRKLSEFINSLNKKTIR